MTLQNRDISSIEVDYLYHIGLNTQSCDFSKEFGDIKVSYFLKENILLVIVFISYREHDTEKSWIFSIYLSNIYIEFSSELRSR